MRTREELRDMLDYIDPASCSYDEWVAVGMAIHQEGGTAEDWENWSATDAGRYHKGECYKKWGTFHGGAKGEIVTGGTLYEMACRGGWTPGGKGTALMWDDVIGGGRQDGVVVDHEWIEGEDIQEPDDEKWNPVQEIVTYLSALFESTEYVGYVTESWQGEDGRYMPTKGTYSRTAGELINELRRRGDIGAALGDYNPECGAWVRFNPLDGQGIRNANVTEYRYALVESDTLDIPRQNDLIRQLELPVAVLVHSGGKSLHAIVRIDAESYDEYRQRVNYLYKICERNGLAIDKQNRNPSRLSRLPGVMRGGHRQYIVARDIGKKDFAEWQEWIESESDDLPDTENIADTWDNLPPLAPALIDGVLRQGHKMLIAGPSKAGKSFALLELAIAIAEGKTWMGWQCAQGKVLYVNLELDRASCLNRVHDVYTAMGIEPASKQNIDVWNLRGKSVPMDRLAPRLIRRARTKNYIAVIIDPIYKIITGDENSADQMSQFCNQFDLVCTELGCAVIYCHHHSKGAQGDKRSMDRASGSGVFARDPDALLDILQIDIDADTIAALKNRAVAGEALKYLSDIRPELVSEVTPEAAQSSRDMLDFLVSHVTEAEYNAFVGRIEGIKDRVGRRTAWRIEGTLREFPAFVPVDIWFDYPVHHLDREITALARARKGGVSNLGRKKDAQQRKDDRRKSVESVYQIVASFDSEKPVTLKAMAEYSGASERTIKRHLYEHGGFMITNQGEVIPKEVVK